jgi:hypothetical protein
MLDLDPRDYDSRDEERHANAPSRGRGSSGLHDRDHDWRQPDARTRDRDDGDERSLGRGPGNDRQGSDTEGGDRDHDPRWTDRDRDDRERDVTRSTFLTSASSIRSRMDVGSVRTSRSSPPTIAAPMARAWRARASPVIAG